jgi:hypothetical protein
MEAAAVFTFNVGTILRRAYPCRLQIRDLISSSFVSARTASRIWRLAEEARGDAQEKGPKSDIFHVTRMTPKRADGCYRAVRLLGDQGQTQCASGSLNCAVSVKACRIALWCWMPNWCRRSGVRIAFQGWR